MHTRLIDLSHVITSGTQTYKGLPAPLICDYLSRETAANWYENGETFQIGKIEMVTNTGTYIDCPFHRYADGDDLSQMDLSFFVDLPAEIISIHHTACLAIGPAHFKDKSLKNKAVLIHTGWSQFWNTEQYFEHHPYLTAEAAVYLQEQGVVLVGIDSHNIDNTQTQSRPVHSHLLGHNILIVEHLCGLEQIPNQPFTFSAVPPKFKGVGTFPIRAYAKISRSYSS